MLSFGYESKLNHQTTASLSPWFHLPGFHFGYPCLTRSHFCQRNSKWRAGDTVDGRNPAPPKRPWRDDSPVNTNERYGFNHGFQLVRNGFCPFTDRTGAPCSEATRWFSPWRCWASSPRGFITPGSSISFLCAAWIHGLSGNPGVLEGCVIRFLGATRIFRGGGKPKETDLRFLFRGLLQDTVLTKEGG